ncbi:hypothetical protein SAMN02927921_01817 [Sinomicrobium oceani]|uniref:Uncharacterized protein n=1 Tax=Sinomicrobium oceani TaxID=1150368 RepID=A0A1K1PIC4_9FLAO|nr:hypothetical protein [Sinomicrobium oceani]SFW47536.1 hypothetical protein SAMN02927921_01817 [Sinomicrobium oceani]
MESEDDKIRKLFENSNAPRERDTIYAGLLSEYMTFFKKEFPDDWDDEQILAFAVHTWNTANIQLRLSPDGPNRIDPDQEPVSWTTDLMMKMVSYKMIHYKPYDRVFIEFEYDNGNLKVQTESGELFLQMFLEEQESEDIGEDADFDEGYVNRRAVTLKPKQPFIDWINSFSEDKIPLAEVEGNVYLLDTSVYEPDEWIEKKFDKLFIKELSHWHPESFWPKERTYKMFRKWFHIDSSTLVYDLVKEPLTKDY